MVQFIDMPKYQASPLLDLSPLAQGLQMRQRAQEAEAKRAMQERQMSESQRQFSMSHQLAQNADQRQAALAPGQLEAQTLANAHTQAMNPLERRLKLAQAAQAERPPAPEITEIYDANGRPTKAAVDPRNPTNYQPIGGAKALKPDENITTAQKALDREFGKDYAEFATGGFADIEKNLAQWKGVKARLDAIADPKNKGSKENLTGPIVGRIPDWANAFLNPPAVNTRETVEEVVQRNLRVILGAQFTNEEGKRLIARAYNPALDEKENAQRIGNLINAMDRALQAKIAAAEYFEKNGTLVGYKGSTRFSTADLENSIDAPKSQARLAPGQAAPGAASPQGQGGPVPRVNSVQEAMRLPKGTKFIDPNGVLREVP